MTYRILFNVQVTIAGFIAVVATIAVYSYCRKQLQRNRQYDINRNLSRFRDDLLKKVEFRAVFYSLAFVNTLAWPIMLGVIGGNYTARIVEEDSANDVPPMPIGLYILNLLANFFYPLQGLINFLMLADRCQQ